MFPPPPEFSTPLGRSLTFSSQFALHSLRALDPCPNMIPKYRRAFVGRALYDFFPPQQS